MAWFDLQKEEIKINEKISTRRKNECLELSTKYLFKRAYSESQLLDALKLELKTNHSYHCISNGDVDSLSYLKVILLHQNIDYCLFSSWCMAAEDVLQIKEWIIEGRIKKLDAYVGEIFPSSYKIEYKMLQDVFNEFNCGRICVFKNHSKIYAGWGEKFHFAIESSANINTNPRTENTTIIINKELALFYKNYFDNINSII